MNKNKNIITVITFTFILLIFSALCYAKPETEFSDSERRPLATMPELNLSTVFNGEFMNNFEEFTVDQIPFRDKFRSIKALFLKNIYRKLDNNGLFIAEGHLSKLDAEENDAMIEHSANRFRYIYDTYIKNKECAVYFSIVPDKNFVIAQKNGFPSMDYTSFINKMKNKTEYMEYIDISNMLSSEDYFYTDSHWKQEKIIDIANKIGTSMHTDVTSEYTVNSLNNPFYGVYTGQLPIPFMPDEIKYLTNDTINNCKVTYYDTGLPVKGEMYNMKKAFGKDPYEMFLSGTSALITIENEKSKTAKELILFRDSFGSSLAPLLAEGYKKITVIDIRYIQSSYIGNFVKFNDQDVLFIYSTTLLNNSLALR